MQSRHQQRQGDTFVWTWQCKPTRSTVRVRSFLPLWFVCYKCKSWESYVAVAIQCSIPQCGAHCTYQLGYSKYISDYVAQCRINPFLHYTNDACWRVWHANIYVPKLKCQHEGSPECWHFNWGTCIFACHVSPSCVICFVTSLTKIHHNYVTSQVWSHAHRGASVMHDGLLWHILMSRRCDVTLKYVTWHVTEFGPIATHHFS